jgi:predicted metal-dependent peptidase
MRASSCLSPREQMVAARTNLLLSQPFLGALSLRLKLIETDSVPTAATDGVVLKYNPSFVDALTPAARQGLIAHEVLHCAEGHPWRRDGREPRRYNRAADYAINPIVAAAGMELPQGALLDDAYKGLSSERIYSLLPPDPPSESQDGDGGEGDGDPDPGGCGAVEDYRPGQDQQSIDPAALSAEWQAATVAAAAQATGKLPAGMERIVERCRRPACRDLVAALSEFAAQAAREDYSWRRPNARYMAQGLYLPVLASEELPPIVAAVDTSGSIDQELLARYVEALQVVLNEARPSRLVVIAADAAVRSERELVPGETVPGTGYAGGGGTDFRPVFERVEQMEEPPCAIVYLTDLEGTFPDRAPDCPTLWVVADPGDRESSVFRPFGPFGQTIWLEG